MSPSPFSTASPSAAASPVFFGTSETAARLRAFDWSAHPLGDPAHWPVLLRQMLNMVLASPESMYIVWGPGYHFFHNDAYAPHLGPRHAQSIGRTLPDLWADAFEAVRPSVEAGFRGEAIVFRDAPIGMARRGEPEETWWSFSYSPLRDEAGAVQGVLCHTDETTAHVVNETERRRAEQQLREMNAALARERNRLWDVSRELLVIADLQGRWLSVNPELMATLGWSEAELVGRTSEWMEHPDDRARTRVEVAELAQGRTTTSFEVRLRTRDGRYRRLSWKTTPSDGLLYASARDVTEERERMEQLAGATRELRQSEARARTYFSASPEFLLLLNVDADGRVTFGDINPTVEHLIQRSRDEVVGHELRDFLPEQSSADAERCARACMRTGANERYEAHRQYPDRAPVVVELLVAPVERHEDGGGLALFIGRDVSSQRIAEEQLRQAQKMEAVGQLTGGIAHDFNNLLSTIGTSLELLQRRLRGGDVEEQERHLARAARSVQSAASLTHRLLAFSRQQTLDARAVDVNRLAQGLAEMFKRTLGEQVALELVLQPDAWPVRTDAGQLESALLNLALNARDAMPHGGRLAIATANVVVTGEHAPADLAPGDYLAITVTDNGTGMPQEVMDRAFDPFYTTKPIGKGSGLGLSMIYGYARQSGGQVRLQSTVGEGTSVQVWLPRVQTADEAFLPDARADTALGRGQRVLLVEDDAELRATMLEALEELGYVTDAAADAPEALAQLRGDRRYDLLVTDVGLPGMSGRELAGQSRALRPDLPVLLMTGYAEGATDRGRFVGEGMDLLPKPFTLDVFAGAVHKALGRR